jgi:membrane-associated protease RseP (regulator of RpoE activity)
VSSSPPASFESFSSPPSIPPPSVPPTSARGPVRFDWRKNLLLFLATVLTVFGAGAMMRQGVHGAEFSLLAGWTFAVPLLLILVFHEFGHWIAARLHGVPASLPYFIPLPPQLFMFGTMGAVIMMPERIRSRNALLDIGAAGPIAGMVIAIPALIIGLHLSEVRPQAPGGYLQEGQSLLYWLIKRATLGPIPAGHDVYIHETALAGWAGFLITMMNMLPWGQLDGGHITYALLGEKHHAVALWVRRALPLLFLYNLVQFVGPVALGKSEMSWLVAFGNSLFWLMWFGVTGLMSRASGGYKHPPCEPGQLSPLRKAVAIGTLVMFVLLFMPTPLAQY